jgi:predicted transglutaminase-like cysteine proteinase
MRVRSIGSLLRSAAMLAAIVAALLGARAQAEAAGFERTGEMRFDELLELAQWRAVRVTLPQEAARVRGCSKAQCSDAAAMWFARIVREGKALDRRRQLDVVQAAVNSRPYREDAEQFGAEDKWQSPLGFARRGGDCEDFAIAKYFALTLLGFSRSDLRIAVMTRGAQGEVHAILLARIDSRWLALDNREKRPGDLTRYARWTPRYAVTETAGFRYVDSGKAALASAPAER